MKKLLLIAAMAAVALGASAGYNLEKLWEFETSDLGLDLAQTRQGFGMDGKFYINDKSTQTILIVDENGLSQTTLPGGLNCGITRDEAGNIIVSNWQFPNNCIGGNILVVDPITGEVLKNYTIPDDCGLQGRSDFIGFAKGDMTQDGAIYLFGGNSPTPLNPEPTSPWTDGIAVVTIADGDVDVDNCYTVPMDGLIGINTSVVYYYKDLAGEDALIFSYRSGADSKITFDGEEMIRSTFLLPNKGASNGVFPLIWDGKEMFIYPNKPNYGNGFAIGEIGAEEPIIQVEATISTAANSFQANWVNAEITEDGVIIYQYYPGKNITVYRLTKDEPNVPHVYMLGGDSNDWYPTQGQEIDYDAENDVYTANITFPDEYNFFGFTTELAENNDDGGWIYIEPFRFGAIADEGTDFLYEGQEYVSLTWDEYHAIGIKGGEYKLTIDLNKMRLYIEDLNPQGIRGDVNMDGFVKIDDVTALIDYLLGGNEEGIDINAADCNKSGDVKIDDVTTLIDYLLGGNWPN